MPSRLKLTIAVSDVKPIPGGAKREGAINARFKHDVMLSDGCTSYNWFFPGCVAYMTESGTIDFHYAQNKFGGTTSANTHAKDLVRTAIRENADIVRIVKPVPICDSGKPQEEPLPSSTQAMEANL